MSESNLTENGDGTGSSALCDSANGGGQLTTTMSRFKLVHVDARFQRGRWKCWDYMEKDGEDEESINLDQKKKDSEWRLCLTIGLSE